MVCRGSETQVVAHWVICGVGMQRLRAPRGVKTIGTFPLRSLGPTEEVDFFWLLLF